MIKMKNIICFVILIAFYFIFGYLLFGNPLAIFAVGIGGILFLFLSSSVPILLLFSDKIREGNYSKDNVMLSVNITHILLVISLISFVAIYNNYFGDISPVLGYIVMGVSLLINLLCLIKDIKKNLGLDCIEFTYFNVYNFYILAIRWNHSYFTRSYVYDRS